MVKSIFYTYLRQFCGQWLYTVRLPLLALPGDPLHQLNQPEPASSVIEPCSTKMYTCISHPRWLRLNWDPPYPNKLSLHVSWFCCNGAKLVLKIRERRSISNYTKQQFSPCFLLQWHILLPFFPCLLFLIEQWIVSLSLRCSAEHSYISVGPTYWIRMCPSAISSV